MLLFNVCVKITAKNLGVYLEVLLRIYLHNLNFLALLTVEIDMTVYSLW